MPRVEKIKGNETMASELPRKDKAATAMLDATSDTSGKGAGWATGIDPDTAELFISEKKIGERIKRLRLRKSMGLVELGRHTGLSASFLSQLETGRVVPTLRNLARIAMVFSKDLSYFFEPEPHSVFRIHRKQERVRLPQTGVDDPTYYFESLAYMVPDRHIDPYLAEFVPLKKNVDVRPHVHVGQEFLYVVDGSLEVKHGEKTGTLEAGDCVYFDASTQHSYRCIGTEKATVVIVTMQYAPQQRPVTAARLINGATPLLPGQLARTPMVPPTELPPLRRPMRQ